jgi:hypothetical protein
MKFLFALIFILDLIVLLASYTTEQAWASTVCTHLKDLCDYHGTLEVVGVLSFGMMLVTWGY